MANVIPHSLLTEQDIYLFKEGSHFRLYEHLGARLLNVNGQDGAFFAVWAPNAKFVSVVGSFNGWNRAEHPLNVRWDCSGIWEGFIPGVKQGDIYKFYMESLQHNFKTEKKDPFGSFSEKPPQTASMVWDLSYTWEDSAWMANRGKRNALNAPFSVYEMHLGSWRKKPEENNRYLTYTEIAEQLIPYIKEMGFTHVEFMPVMDHPFYQSWGYQVLGYFGPTPFYGTPQELMSLIDQLHQNDIGVILDWVPSHFPFDAHGLYFFDGSHVYEHSDPRKGVHPDWNCCVFNNGRNEVKEFLISSALFWLDKYHADGLRVDAVASMLYLDYSRQHGAWSPNIYGGNENLESIVFIRALNENVYKFYPDTQMIAEESTAWGNVSRPTVNGGLGFGMKWNMGWMHDTLEYFKKDPVYRKYHQNELTFSMLYAYTENFLLSLSHDEVVHGKGSLLTKMPCDDWQKFANLRALLTYMYAHPGKKLLFMGIELAQRNEWNNNAALDWHLLQHESHRGVQTLMKDINRIYRSQPALYEDDFTFNGFEWIDAGDWQRSIVSFLRKGKHKKDTVLVVCNFTPSPHSNYRIGVPVPGFWQEILNSDAKEYWGAGMGNMGGVLSKPVPQHGRKHSIALTLPPLSVVYYKRRSPVIDHPSSAEDPADLTSSDSSKHA
ncbi:MAG: 1,4-alpha-glucan branching protein GlgB [Candidatus Omnitrophica bacterium]|nr:1,4-alpha-glucan branching protein GlgB [Candidatus Omnitrophota bacterium]